jgi:hypothetical protein
MTATRIAAEVASGVTSDDAAEPGKARAGARAPSASELLETAGALLTRSHLRELGLGRAAIDAVFRELDIVMFPGSSRPHVRRDDYLALVEASTYSDERVRLTAR